MRTFLRVTLPILLSIFASSSSTMKAGAQVPASANVAVPSRITGSIENGSRAVLAGSKPPRTLLASDLGAVSPSMALEGMTLVFAHSSVQDAELKQLLADQQNQSSPLYHQWLTPQQFGARFGMSDADLAKATAWLESQGFKIVGISNSRDRIQFSGTAGQVAASLGTEIHRFSEGGETHFSPAAEISLPAALANVVLAVGNLSDYRPKPHARFKAPVKPDFTSGSSGNHYLTPKDVATIYDLNAVYNAGYTGAGETIAVMGQSAVVASDITAFQTAAGVPVRAPTMVLVPSTGSSALVSNDEGESDLDLEYTSGMATGATVKFVYTGNAANSGGAFTSLQYAIDLGLSLAPILSVSYGTCELELSSSTFSQFDAIFAQAATQGQTVIVSSGDNGSTTCNGFTDLSTAQQESLNADFPADSQYVTGLGGSEFTSSAVAIGSSYWTNTANTDVISSALSYMPEMVWNDDAPPSNVTAGGLSSGGGGISTLEARPIWQVPGIVPGIPSGMTRLIPDISLAASPNNAGYLYCSSDTKSTGSTAGSCVNGFRDANNQFLTVAGGTSFAAPVFAGMLAVMSQKLGSTGLGNINPKLYSLASNNTTYTTAFHDITVGGNQCLAGPTFCSTAGTGSYAADVGYDVASGLGSLDLNNLLSAWVTSLSPAPGFTLTPTGSISIAAGATTGNTASVSVASVLGFNGTVSLSCTIITNATTPPTCSMSPASVSVTGTTPATSVLTITTIARQVSQSGTKQAALRGFGTATLAGLLMLSLPLARRRRNWRSLVVVLFCAAAFAGLSGCGNNSTPTAVTSKTGGTTAGSYSVAITGTAAGTTAQTVTLTLGIN